MSKPHASPSVDTDTAEYVGFDDLVARFYHRFPKERVEAEFAAISDAGRVRQNNEDHYLVVRRHRTREVLLTSLPRESLPQTFESAYTYAVADGLGGRDFGELASFLALRTGWLLGAQELSWTVRVTDREAEELQRKAEVFFKLIHRVLQQAALVDPRKSGMGTTLTLAYSAGPDLFVLHAGDSRAYLFRAGKLKRLTRDHTMSQLLVDTGMTEAGSELARRTKRVLVNCLGGNELGIDVDFNQHALRDGDRVLVCSDGLTDMIDDALITRILSDHSDRNAACRALVDAALDQGGKDNITVVLADYRIRGDDSVPTETGLTKYLPAIPSRAES
jgi:protein phosphatase